MGDGVELLVDLAGKINEEHRLCQRAAASVVEHALRAGGLLYSSKAAYAFKACKQRVPAAHLRPSHCFARQAAVARTTRKRLKPRNSFLHGNVITRAKLPCIRRPSASTRFLPGKSLASGGPGRVPCGILGTHQVQGFAAFNGVRLQGTVDAAERPR